MDRRRPGWAPSSSDLGDGRAGFCPPQPPPNYSSSVVRDALEHLASIDLTELCNEAKIERCRATRDLSSCGRCVQHVLTSCGHASLCAECSQRCDVCPICRTSIPKKGSRLRLRLYYECIEAGLISKRHDDRFQEEDRGDHLMADIGRLYSLFDVALENNLASLICHYVTDVCMDEDAVSSDPVLAFLLDEAVVKDWCKQTFNNVIHNLREIYSLGVKTMNSKLFLLEKFVLQLNGIANVLEVMVSSFKDTFSAQLHDLHHMLENTMKTKQHLEVMIWCTRHQFLEGVQSRYPNPGSWILHVHERKKAAVNRSWPDYSSNVTDSADVHGPALFIEEALSNLGMEKREEDVEISCLQDESIPLLFLSRIDEANKNGCYPFQNLRAAIDILFLHGTSDMVVAKQAIFLYYIFDRHWTRPEAEWKYLVDDFAASFSITRHLILESLVFYLLDDHTSEALEEAKQLLPEIARSETHPKIAQVLLERQRPDVSLTVLRCSGRDGFCAFADYEHDGSQFVSLGEAVTAVRVRIECGLLTEAFMYQRTHCLKVKEVKPKCASNVAFSNNLKSDWMHHVEVLVTEICNLCIRRNLVDRMIELPWDSFEEKFLHKCLFDYAYQNPATIFGSLLVVFYLQRYRYIEAYEVSRNLRSLEQNVVETANENVASKITLICQWREGLIEKCLELLPEVQKQNLRNRNMADNSHLSSEDVRVPSESAFSNMLANPDALLTSTSVDSSILYQTNFSSLSPKNVNAHATLNSTIGSKGPSILQHRLLASLGSPTSRTNAAAVDGISLSKPKNREKSLPNDMNAKDMRWQADFRQGFPPVDHPSPASFRFGSQSTPLKELNASALRLPQNDRRPQGEKDSTRTGPFDFIVNAENFHPVMPRVISEHRSSDLMTMSHSNGFLNEPSHDQSPEILGNQNLHDDSWTKITEANTNLWSFGKRDSPNEHRSMTAGSRWRSDESSEDEEQGLDSHMGGGASFAVRRRARFSRR